MCSQITGTHVVKSFLHEGKNPHAVLPGQANPVLPSDNTTEIQKGIRNHCEPLHTNESGNLGEMDELLETHNLLRLNHEEIEYLKRLITSDEIESVTTKLSKTKVQNQKAS